jgi:transposase, IS30 family
MQGHHGHLSAEQKQLAFRLRQRGWRLTAIAREIGCTAPMVGLMVSSGKHLDAAPFGWEPRSGSLTIQEREQILLGIGRGDSLSEIARSLGRAPSTVTREVNANGGRKAVLGLACARSSSSTGSPPEALQTPAGQVAAGSLEAARAALVPRGDRSALTVGVSRRPGDASEPRDHLPVALRAGKRRTTS